jgi:hypothetical protein
MKVSHIVAVAIVAASCLSTRLAHSEPKIPEGAKPLNGAEIKEFLDGRTFRLVVYDAKKSLTGTSTWELNEGRVHGEYSWDNQDPKSWSRKWYVENDLNCTKPTKGDAECNRIYLDGEKFIEVRQDGVIHAVSTPLE